MLENGTRSPPPIRGILATMNGTRADSSVPQTSGLHVALSMMMPEWVE